MLESIALGLTHLESQKMMVVRGMASCFDQLVVRLMELQDQEVVTEQISTVAVQCGVAAAVAKKAETVMSAMTLSIYLIYL
jgi:hypothetical protein